MYLHRGIHIPQSMPRYRRGPRRAPSRGQCSCWLSEIGARWTSPQAIPKDCMARTDQSLKLHFRFPVFISGLTPFTHLDSTTDTINAHRPRCTHFLFLPGSIATRRLCHDFKEMRSEQDLCKPLSWPKLFSACSVYRCQTARRKWGR